MNFNFLTYKTLLYITVFSILLSYVWVKLIHRIIDSNVSIHTVLGEQDIKALITTPILLPLSTTPSAFHKNTYRLPIVLYHYVEEVDDPSDSIRKKMDVEPVIFESHLRKLTDEGFTSYFIAEIPDIISGKKIAAEKSIFLTFDDGYEDFYIHVFPLLKKYHMKATFYVVYNFIGKKGYISDGQLREIIAMGNIEIGSHTIHHRALKGANTETAREEIVYSKELFEKVYGLDVKTFAYPYGSISSETVQVVKEAGYIAAVSTINGLIQSENNLFTLSRIRPYLLSSSSIIRALGEIEIVSSPDVTPGSSQ